MLSHYLWYIPICQVFFFKLIHCSLHYKNNKYVECAFSIYIQASLCLIPNQKKKKILASSYHHHHHHHHLITHCQFDKNPWFSNHTGSQFESWYGLGDSANPLPPLRSHLPICKIQKLFQWPWKSSPPLMLSFFRSCYSLYLWISPKNTPEITVSLLIGSISTTGEANIY